MGRREGPDLDLIPFNLDPCTFSHLLNLLTFIFLQIILNNNSNNINDINNNNINNNTMFTNSFLQCVRNDRIRSSKANVSRLLQVAFITQRYMARSATDSRKKGKKGLSMGKGTLGERQLRRTTLWVQKVDFMERLRTSLVHDNNKPRYLVF